MRLSVKLLLILPCVAGFHSISRWTAPNTDVLEIVTQSQLFPAE